MAEHINMPQLGLTMTEGTMGKWKKNVGDSIAVGDVLVEVMTDKITSEIEAKVAGVLRVIVAKEGETIPVQGLLAIIGTADEKIDEGSAGTGVSAAVASDTTASVKQAAKFSPAARRLAEEKGINIQAVPGSGPDGRIVVADVEKYLATVPQIPVGGRVKASPLAKKIAGELAVDLTTVIGSGPEGRIVEEDVRKAALAPVVAQVPASAPVVSTPVKAAAVGEPLVGMRKVIAERMTFSKHTAPHVTIMTEINVDATVAFRAEINGRNKDVRVTYTDILTKMVATALGHFPAINASLIDNAIVKHEAINIGVAVALDNGLMVPVLRNADKCGLKEIHEQCAENAQKARSNQLSMDLLSGGTFTISNLGGYDVDGFTPIINQPESAILGVGRIVKKPVVVNNEITIASMMTLSLSFDHRVVDGAQAAQFLKAIKTYLEDPMSMLM
jgi:pyruvate dehydrogenase E2 component (dihydrolipoamide acetyltransferase)